MGRAWKSIVTSPTPATASFSPTDSNRRRRPFWIRATVHEFEDDRPGANKNPNPASPAVVRLGSPARERKPLGS